MSQLLRYALKLPVRILERSFTIPFCLASLIIPRSKHLWAFGSSYGLRFADNPRYFFLYCSRLEPSVITPVWLSASRAIVDSVRQLGLRAHHRLSPVGLWYRLRAGVYIVDCRVMDIGANTASGAIIVNLWHGVPLKKIERDIEQPQHAIVRARTSSLPVRVANRLLRPQLTERYDLILATSRTTTERFGSAFGVAPGQVITVGYPRTDPLLASEQPYRDLIREERQLVDELVSHADAGRRVLLYMPTFRDWHNDSSRGIPIDWQALNHTLTAHSAVFYCKLHPSDHARLPALDHLPSIRSIRPSLDIYPILRHTDALITDYSSIFFDYLLLDKPILFYPYDLDEYQRLSRSLYDPYEEATPGPKAFTPEQLQVLIVQLLEAYDDVADQWRGRRVHVRQQAHEFADDRASERLLGALREKLHI